MALRQPLGIALHVGLNQVSVDHYGTPATLFGCHNDAREMHKLSTAQGYSTTVLLDGEATSEAVLDTIRKAAASLEPGDIFLFTYSGHGSRVRDLNGDEGSGRDSTLVLFDRMLLDDELWQVWKLFRSGVRILVVADSCHSGTVVKDPGALFGDDDAGEPVLIDGVEYDPATLRPANVKVRALPLDDAARAFSRNREWYEEVVSTVRGGDDEEVAASVVLLSACQDNQLASDGDDNGLFTRELLRVLRQGPRDYRELHKRIVADMPSTQSPNFYTVGTPNPTFEKEPPFAIGALPFRGRPLGAGITGTTTGTANFRSSPGYGQNLIRSLPAQTSVLVVGNDQDWLQVVVGAENGYVHMSLVETLAGATGSWSTVATTGLNVRSGPSTSFPVVGSVAGGASAEVIGWDRQARWLKIAQGVGSGYVSSTYTRGIRVIIPETGPLDTAAIRALRAEIEVGDPALRASRYENLQRRVIYRSQRDNQALENGQLIETQSGRMCNLTSLAMALSVIGIDNPKPSVQYEDALEEIRQVNGFGPRTTSAGWGSVARAVGADWRFIRSSEFQEPKAWWFATIRPLLAQGQGLMMSINGHIVRVEAVTDDGLVVDDPFGKCKLLPGGGSNKWSWIAKNPYGAPGSVGDSVTWPWAEVEAHPMFWIAAFTRASRDFSAFLQPFVHVEDHGILDPDDE